MQPKSLFSPGRAAHEASTAQFEELNCSTLHPISYLTQTLKLGHAAKKLMRIMKNSAECSSKDESDEIKNIHEEKGYICLYAEDYTSEEGEWALVGVSGSPEWSAEKDSSASLSLGRSKLKSKPG